MKLVSEDTENSFFVVVCFSCISENFPAFWIFCLKAESLTLSYQFQDIKTERLFHFNMKTQHPKV